jgi:hypothetical protein
MVTEKATHIKPALPVSLLGGGQLYEIRTFS